MYSTKGHRPVPLARPASTPWKGVTKECEGNDPLRHGSDNLQGRRGEYVQYMEIYGLFTSAFISLRLHVAKVYSGGFLPNFLLF
ncbi:hypothetical protein QFZ80_003137 [Paenibacillus sp. V4I7]|nr:hypothetical protein [Paenibacillus sp. V4I7]